MKNPVRISKFAISAMIMGTLALSGCSTTSQKTATKAISVSKSVKSKSRHAKIKPTHAVASSVTRTGEVILLRGLANIFSRGMDAMGNRLRAKGVDARVYNHRAWESLAIDIVARSKTKQVSYPIIIMGHSLGGNASVQMATYLGEHGIPVSYVVTFDPTVTTYAGPKIKRIVNYYLPNGKNTVHRGRDFKGRLANINVSNIPGIKHTLVEKTPKLQNTSIKTIMSLVKKRRRHRRRS